MSHDETIRVVSRIRPILANDEDVDQAVFVEQDNRIVVYNEAFPSFYQFDKVFDHDSNQQDVFNHSGIPLVDAACDGYNSAIFAYGQTGTGKTHTMLGVDLWDLASRSKLTGGSIDLDQLLNRKESAQRGLIPRAMERIFEYVNTKTPGFEPTIHVSYLEIYNEKIYDLLNYEESKATKSGLEIREDRANGVFVPDAVRVTVSSLHQVLEVLWRGALNRAISATDMNEHSSRSHTIFQVYFEQHNSTAPLHNSNGTRRPSSAHSTRSLPSHQNRGHMIRRSKLSLVDLAGSEKWRSHQLNSFSEQRIQEMTSINKSLSNLGNVIRGLLQPGRSHIPYRNSKLTRLLQDSLGGNTKTSFVVTLSPASGSLDETISTLQFADRAKRVVVHPSVNEQPDDASMIRRLEGEVARLQRLLRNANQARGRDTEPGREAVREMREKVQNMEKQLKQEKEKTMALSRALPRNGPRRGNNGGGEGNIAQLDEDALKLAPRLTEYRNSLGAAPHRVSARKELMECYHQWLQEKNISGVAVDTLPMDHRVTLMEWSVLIQAGELDQALKLFETEKKTLQSKLAAKDAQVQALKAQLKTASHRLAGYEDEVATQASKSSASTYEENRVPSNHDGEDLQQYHRQGAQTHKSNARIVIPSGDADVWTKHLDRKTGRTYYHNKESGKSTWRLPSYGLVVEKSSLPLREARQHTSDNNCRFK